MRHLAKFAALAALAAPGLAHTVLAQTEAPPPPPAPAEMPAMPPPGAPPPPAAAPGPAQRPPRMTMRDRFERANVTHDGHLTREQAREMPYVEHHFDAIDAAHRGFVTMGEIHAYMVAHKRQLPPGAPPMSPPPPQ